MANIVIKVEPLPGIVKVIDITLEELLKSFNNSWKLEDRLELVMQLDLGKSTSENKLLPVAKIFKNLAVEELTVGQLLVLEGELLTMLKRIQEQKDLIRKKNEDYD